HTSSRKDRLPVSTSIRNRPHSIPWHQRDHGSHKCTAADQILSVQHPGCIPNWGDRGYSIAASQILPPSKILNSMLYCHKGGMLAWNTCFLTALMKCGTRPAAMVRTIFATIRPNGTIFLRCPS